ncbi:hypothetical protein BH09PSE4_BH09PSE4_10750 [soil metagenome]
MNGGQRIIGLRPEDVAALSQDAAAADTPVDDLSLEAFDDPPRRRFGWLLPTLAMIAVLAWFAAAISFSWPMLQPPVPVLSLVQFVAALCMPPALIGILWLLALRTSTAEARRFGATARDMRAEAASLERTISVLSRHLEANKAMLSEQTDALLGMGDRAAERLAAISNGMSSEMRAVDIHAQKLNETTAGTLGSLSVLLTSLPRAHSETADMAQTLETTGRTATGQAAALEAQLASLAERGREADTVTGAAAQHLAAHIARMEATSETASARLELVTGQMSSAVDDVLVRASGAVDQARQGISAQGDAMLAMLEANQSALDRASRDTVEALGNRIASIETAIDRIAARLDEQRIAGDGLVDGLNAGLSDVQGKLDALHEQGVSRTQDLAASIGALGGSADAMTEALRQGDAMGRTVIGTAEEVLTSLDAAAREIDETLPEALTRLDARIADTRAVVAASKPELLALVTAAESTHTAIEAIADVIAGQRETVDELSSTLLETLNNGRDKADALGAMIEDTIDRTQSFARDAAPQLVEALLRVRDTAAAAADRARQTLAAVIPEVSRTLEDASGDALKRAVAASIEGQLEAIADASDAAVDAAQRASERLTRQLLSIAETTATVEARIEEARAEREAADTDNFARRASLLIESLNSAAIDINKSFSAEVSDSAWAAYLKGDRGVFTRRAVRLLDAGETKEIVRLYDDDAVFREQVNRYIHDFEAMLRGILTHRDASPLGVTLLSSDMGKLYVAMAQAIERLRA